MDAPPRPQSASAVHGVRFSDEEGRPSPGRPRSAMDFRRDPHRDQLRPNSAGTRGTRRVVSYSSGISLSAGSVRGVPSPHYDPSPDDNDGWRHLLDDEDQDTLEGVWDQVSVGSTVSDSRPSTRPSSAMSHQSGRAQRPGEYRPDLLPSSSNRPLSYIAWKTAAGPGSFLSTSAALLDRAKAVAKEEALGPHPGYGYAFYGNSAATLRMGETHTTQGLAFTASVFNQRLAAGLVPGGRSRLSKAARHLCDEGHTMHLPREHPARHLLHALKVRTERRHTTPEWRWGLIFLKPF
ncbi:hypothetical protein T484DRAFT_3297178 [Baffinella frigidus]|nr:hypothetical protein T484DRAFT_3297178 [Cryptophyta sp. CCMP2293]